MTQKVDLEMRRKQIMTEKMDLKMRYKVCVSENTVSPSQGSPVSSYLDKHILPENIILGTILYSLLIGKALSQWLSCLLNKV